METVVYRDPRSMSPQGGASRFRPRAPADCRSLDGDLH